MSGAMATQAIEAPLRYLSKSGRYMAATWCGDALVVGSIVTSAGTYLLDFASNLVVLVEYSTRFITLSRREKQGISSCDASCRHQTSDLTGYFYALLAILVCCHSLNALLFKLKFTHREAPLFAAYFLPLIHLYRLCHLLWRSLSRKGIQDIRSPEMNGLYCILGSAMEGVPMLILQFCAYLVLTREGIFLHSMSTTFKVSVAASLLSAGYNGGTSVQSIAKNATALKQKLAAGAIGAGFTLCATLVRVLTFTNVVVHVREYFSQQRTEREQAKFHVSDSAPLLVISGTIIAYSLYFWLLHSPRDFSKSLRNGHCLMAALAFSYMSMTLGPLYPLISQANDANQLGGCIFRVKLLVVSLLHLSLDLAVLCVTNMLGTLPKPYLIISSLGAFGYMVFLLAYMKFDESCGPMPRSDVSIVQAAQGDDNAKDHKVVPLGMLTNVNDHIINDNVVIHIVIEESNDLNLISPDKLTNGQQQEMEKPEVEAILRHVNSSSQSTVVMACTLEEPFRKPQEHMTGKRSLVLTSDVDMTQAKACRPFLISSLSLDTGMKIAIKEERSSIAACSSFHGSSI